MSVVQALKYFIVRSGPLTVSELEDRQPVQIDRDGNVSDKLEQILLQSSSTMQDTLRMSKKLEAIDKKVEAIDKKVETIQAVLEEGGRESTDHPRKPHQNVVGVRNIGSLVNDSSGSSKFNSKVNRNMSTRRNPCRTFSSIFFVIHFGVPRSCMTP